jgi:hypothetical protein
VLLWVEVNVEDQVGEIFLGRYLDAFEPLLKQAACASVNSIEPLGVGIEAIRERLGWIKCAYNSMKCR